MNTDAHRTKTMARNTENGGGRRGSGWRVAGWSAAALVLVLPLVAMQFTDQVNWTVFDFVFAGALILGVGVPFELAMRKTGDTAYRAAVGVALAAGFLLVWINGAVGIIGSENNDANMMYGGVLAVGVVGSIIARFRPPGMAGALVATALAQAAVAVVALAAGLAPEARDLKKIVVLNGFFVVLWAGSALLFWQAARSGPERGAV
jgi:hypothetical protein